MHVYNEIKRGRLSVFEMHVLDENGEDVITTSATMPMYDLPHRGKRVFLLYDDDMRVIPGTYAFLNIRMLDKSANSRRKAAGQLRRLYCFLALTGRSIDSIDDSLLSELLQFLEGVGFDAGGISLKTHRCNNNVNEHLSTYRKYFDFLDVECKALRRTRSLRGKPSLDSGLAPVQRARYANNLPRRGYCERSTPKYISPSEFAALIDCARRACDDAGEIIMTLMYLYGLRIGETLGLTIEDVDEELVDGSLEPVLIVRNRASDRDFQHAKGKRIPLSASEYGSRAYAESQDEILIDRGTHERLVGYVNKAHSLAAAERPSDYDLGRADTASPQRGSEGNRYIFLNRYGRPLSGQTWGNRLKSYFAQAGVPLGWDRGRDNLSHRFRHGFAMLHAHFRRDPVGALELQKLLRHRWLSSTMVYYNPTAEDEAKAKAAFQSDLAKQIPELGAWAFGQKR